MNQLILDALAEAKARRLAAGLTSGISFTTNANATKPMITRTQTRNLGLSQDTLRLLTGTENLFLLTRRQREEAKGELANLMFRALTLRLALLQEDNRMGALT